MKQYIVGHRGAAGLAPENTLKAFKKGFENGADAVECDIHLSQDQKLVVIHDATLDGTTTGTGWIKDYTYSELKKLDAGEGEKIPLLEEVIELTLQHNKTLIIEIKGETWERAKHTTDALTKLLTKNANSIPNIHIYSFWLSTLKRIKKQLPEIKTLLDVDIGLKPEQTIELILEAQANGVAINKDYVSLELVNLLKERNLLLSAWVLNDVSTFKSIKELGVEWLLTDYPGKFK